MWLGSIYPWAGKYRVARLLSVLMASQAGFPSLALSVLAGRGKQTYVQAIHAAMSRDYGPLATLFARALERRHASSST